MSPGLHYRSFQRHCNDVLTSSLSSQLAYYPIQLNSLMQQCRIRTSKILAFFKREAPGAVQNAFKEGVKQ